MPAPYNYMQFMPQVDIGAKFAELGDVLIERRQREESRAVQQQYAQDLQNAFQNPTQETWAQMIAKYPKQREAFGDVAKIYGQERVDNEFRQGAEISNALENGAVELAKGQLQTIIAGYQNSGRSPGIYKQINDLLEAGDVKSAQAAVNMSLSILDPDKFKKVVEGRTAAEKAPLEISKASSEAIIKAAEARFAPEKFGAELNLTNSQIEASKAARRASDAAAKKSGADAARAQAEADQIAAGIIPADKRPEAEAKFRKEYSDQTKGYQEVKSAYSRVLASEETAAGDIALIFNYMKMLDPGSVVREGEFATAQNAGGIGTKIQNLYNNLLTGERLKPEQRKMFAKQAESLYNQAQKQEGTVRAGIERIAKSYGLKPENIFYTPTEVAPTAPAPAGGVRVTSPSGQVFTFPNQQAADQFKRAAGIQ